VPVDAAVIEQARCDARTFDAPGEPSKSHEDSSAHVGTRTALGFGPREAGAAAQAARTHVGTEAPREAWVRAALAAARRKERSVDL